MMTILSASFSFVLLLQYSAAAVLIAFFVGLLGIYFEREAPLGDDVILIEKERDNAA